MPLVGNIYVHRVMYGESPGENCWCFESYQIFYALIFTHSHFCHFAWLSCWNCWKTWLKKPLGIGFEREWYPIWRQNILKRVKVCSTIRQPHILEFILKKWLDHKKSKKRIKEIRVLCVASILNVFQFKSPQFHSSRSRPVWIISEKLLFDLHPQSNKHVWWSLAKLRRREVGYKMLMRWKRSSAVKLAIAYILFLCLIQGGSHW